MFGNTLAPLLPKSCEDKTCLQAVLPLTCSLSGDSHLVRQTACTHKLPANPVLLFFRLLLRGTLLLPKTCMSTPTIPLCLCHSHILFSTFLSQNCSPEHKTSGRQEATPQQTQLRQAQGGSACSPAAGPMCPLSKPHSCELKQTVMSRHTF